MLPLPGMGCESIMTTSPNMIRKKNRRSEQGGGILDGPHKSDSRFWKIRWDDRVEGWSADKKRDGTEIWLDLFASMLSLMLALLTR
jgi:hypothetical protein